MNICIIFFTAKSVVIYRLFAWYGSFLTPYRVKTRPCHSYFSRFAGKKRSARVGVNLNVSLSHATCSDFTLLLNECVIYSCYCYDFHRELYTLRVSLAILLTEVIEVVDLAHSKLVLNYALFANLKGIRAQSGERSQLYGVRC